jgi:iron(III) transport system substrate-binding protein
MFQRLLFTGSVLSALVLALTLSIGGCDSKPVPSSGGTGTSSNSGGSGGDSGGELVLYAGRTLSLVKDVIAEFEKQTGIDVKIKDGKSPALATLLIEEGDKSPADVFWSQDAGSLGAVARAGQFDKIADATMKMLPAKHQTESGMWLAVSGRARVIAYASKTVKKEDLPQSIYDLTDPKWKGKIGWAPRNGSFQAFVTAMRNVDGDDKARAWLEGVKANEPTEYPKNSPIVKALADGEIQVGLPNHYYLLRITEKDPDYPVAQAFFKDGDIGNLVNVSGIGILKTGKNRAAAAKFAKFLLSKWTQEYLTNKVFEYPLIDSVKANARLVGHDALQSALPKVDLGKLDDLDGTRKLLKEVGLISE